MNTDAAIRLKYVSEVTEALWPTPARPPEFTVLPSRRMPRLLVPPTSGKAAAHAVRAYAPATPPVARLLAWALRFRRPRARPRRDEDTIETYLSQVLGRRVVVSLYARPAKRVNRKPVLQALDADGTVLGFVKIGDSPLTRELIQGECDALERLAEAPLQVVEAPRVLHHGLWRDLDVLVLSPLKGRHRKPSARLLTSAAMEIARIDGLRTERTWGGQAITFGAWHGDLSPWNVATDGDRLLVWDWERFGPSAPLGFDLLHYAMQRLLARMRASTAAEACVASAVRLLAPLGLSSEQATLTAVLYLIELSARHPGLGLDSVIERQEALL